MCSFEFSEPSENGVGLNKMFDFSEQGLAVRVFDGKGSNGDSCPFSIGKC